jgi:hypothetical protein
MVLDLEDGQPTDVWGFNDTCGNCGHPRREHARGICLHKGCGCRVSGNWGRAEAKTAQQMAAEAHDRFNRCDTKHFGLCGAKVAEGVRCGNGATRPVCTDCGRCAEHCTCREYAKAEAEAGPDDGPLGSPDMDGDDTEDRSVACGYCGTAHVPCQRTEDLCPICRYCPAHCICKRVTEHH